MSFLKLMSSPLFVFLTTFLATFTLLQLKTLKRHWLLLTLIVTMSWLSLPWGAYSLQSTLLQGQTEAFQAACQKTRLSAITVLSGGYFQGSEASRDLLNNETFRRTLAGADLWKLHPESQLFLQGSDTRETRLMASAAEAQGVPSAKITRESESQTTADHPINLAKLLRTDVPIAIVTSPWHGKRALLVFSIRFSKSIFCPSELTYVPPGGIRNWIFQDSALEASTSMVHEWLGYFWYKVKE